MAKKTWREKYEAAKHHGRRAGAAISRAGGKAKPFMYAGGAGGAGYFAHRYLAQQFDFVKNSPYAGPAILAAGAYVLAKKNREAGLGLAGAAGYALAMGWNSRDLPAPGLPPGSSVGGSATAPATTRGVDDAGLLMGGSESSGPDTDALFGPGAEVGAPEDYA